ncbi:MAG: hypothetical protein PQJ50_00095, partial [Spirochaetales bacterium]|nr:hypothetical protein [Spirochaetales bacterium]
MQPLDDLGYLIISESENSIVDYSDFRNAISQYRNEAIESGFLVRTEIGQELPFEVEACDKNFKQAVEAVSAEELSKLHQLVELEGENPVSVNPDDGFSILELRILRYRASVYGLYSRNGQFDSGAIIRAMERPLHYFFDNPPEGTLELFDNTNNLIKLLSTDKRANLPEKLYLQINLKNSEIRNLLGEKTY